MATFEKQTECVVNALFSDLLGDDESDCRNLETDSEGRPPAGYDAGSVGRRLACIGDDLKTFDAAVIASRLRQMGDRCNMDFEHISSEALAEVLKGEMEKFGAAVDSLSRSWSDQNPELVYESAFLCVSAKLLMYLLKKVPAMVHPSYLIRAINGNSQVRNYIEAHGGWENLDS
ncbi:bcl-2-like protein 15 isoform X2 [Rissa tridactyla]|uniref:bcl-2-like protein 15 isoform X2 n=1 Tax=Rissa tridactyla TaxID=75485 RepID=UPI0023BA8454|nr:bcl-2-like protein 15 isoform X2 [Rissa tridactyla]